MSRSVRNVLGFLLGFLLVVAFASCTNNAKAAAPEFTPLQVAHTGMWADPANSSAGFEIEVVDQGADTFASVVMFAGSGRDSTVPFWLAAYPPWVGTDTFAPLLKTNNSFVDPPIVQSLSEVGTITVTSVDCEHLTVDVDLRSPSPAPPETHQHYDLSALTVPMRSSCFSCSLDDTNPDPRCLL